MTLNRAASSSETLNMTRYREDSTVKCTFLLTYCKIQQCNWFVLIEMGYFVGYIVGSICVHSYSYINVQDLTTLAVPFADNVLGYFVSSFVYELN